MLRWLEARACPYSSQLPERSTQSALGSLSPGVLRPVRSRVAARIKYSPRRAVRLSPPICKRPEIAAPAKMRLQRPGRHDNQNLPTQLCWKVLLDQFVVERSQLGDIRLLMALCVKIVGVEIAHPLEHRFVLLVHQVRVLSLPMSRIERMIANHVKRFGGKVLL